MKFHRKREYPIVLKHFLFPKITYKKENFKITLIKSLKKII